MSYQTIGILATGGMGQVELAIRQQGTFQRLYAIKRLRPEHRQNQGFRDMFVDEARIAGLLRHPNIVSVLDVGEDDEGPYLVMDLVDGLDASKVIKKDRGRLIPVQIATRITEQVAHGLAAAHRLVGLDGELLNLVHRDVSPQNILIGFDGCVRVTDFGIAKAFGRIAETSTGLLKGKAGYMSPEQLSFQHPDQRSDLFSLGIVLFELLSGRRLFRRENAVETAREILNAPTPDIGTTRDDVHPALVELIFELLAKDPDERPSTAHEVAARLRDIAQDLSDEEGTLEVADFMEQEFAEEKQATREHRDALILRAQTLEDEPKEPKVLPELISLKTPSSRPVPQARTSRRAAWVGALAALGSVALAWALWPAAAESVPPPPGSSSVTPAPSVVAEPVPVVLGEEQGEGAEEVPRATVPMQTTMVEGRRRARRRRRVPMSAETSAVMVSSMMNRNAPQGAAEHAVEF